MKDNGISKKLIFGDVYAGCGGLSLGLLQAGFEGRFAVEKDASAFETYKKNLLSVESDLQFNWPSWLPQSPLSTSSLISEYKNGLDSLAGEIDVLAGGPPCQGYSFAGRRNPEDPRNALFRDYLELVKILKPRVVLVENVRGFTADFTIKNGVLNYASELRESLEKSYRVYEELLDLSSFGIPQARRRYFLLAVESGLTMKNPFEELKTQLPSFLRDLGLSSPVSSKSAISDLELGNKGSREFSENPRFREIVPSVPKTSYQKLMNTGCSEIGDLRLANHSENIIKRFKYIIAQSHADGRLNTTISTEMRERLGLKKMALRVLDPDRPAPTITSMPDDLLHYSEPRTLTVRENARLQGFPDWFSFEGKYTTGGHRRRIEVPRFTQVANAVPPLVARAFGEMIIRLFRDVRQE